MGLSSCLMQLAFIIIIITTLCQGTNKNTDATPEGSTSTGTSGSKTTDFTNQEPSATSTITNGSTCTTAPPTSTSSPVSWQSAHVVMTGVGFLALMVIFVLIPLVAITLDRLYSGRKREAYTLNRMGGIGAQLHRLSFFRPGLHTELQGNGNVEDDSILMMPEQAMPEPVPPVSADQTAHLLQDFLPVGPHCDNKHPADSAYEECKFARASAENLDRLLGTSDLEEAKINIQSTNDAKALRFRSYSADSGPNQEKPSIRLYSNPERDKKDRGTPPDASTDMKSNISITGMDDLRALNCSATPFAREDSVDMYGVDSPGSGDCKNESFLHSPEASTAGAAHRHGEEVAMPAVDPLEVVPPSALHVYEELKEMRSVKEASSGTEGNGAAARRDECKITFPQYFELSNLAVKDAMSSTGYMKPKMAHSLPRQAVPYSMRLLSTSTVPELPEGGANESPIRIRSGKGIMAAVKQHRLSDGALDKKQFVHEANPYNSLQRNTTNENVPSMKAYSKLNRGPSAGNQHTSSKSVYDKLKMVGDWDSTGQGSQIHETRR